VKNGTDGEVWAKRIAAEYENFPRDGDGGIKPTQNVLRLIQREHPNESDTTKWRLAIAEMIVRAAKRAKDAA
jgi:hypothetical protein